MKCRGLKNERRLFVSSRRDTAMSRDTNLYKTLIGNNVVGFFLSAQDDGSYMFAEDISNEIRLRSQRRIAEYHAGTISNTLKITEDNRKQNKCPLCGYRLDFQPYNKDYKRKNKTSDIGFTYDGQAIVSTKFKQFCLDRRLEGVIFREFENDKGCFQMIVTREAAFDSKRRRTRFQNLCPVCGNYESVIGATPVCLLTAELLPTGIFRSDLYFADGNAKHPLTLVSPDVKIAMKEARLKGLEFSPAYGTVIE